MKDFVFKLYLLFTVSWFLHLPARFPILGVIRFDLILIVLIFFLIVTNKSGYENKPIDSTSKILIVLFAYTIISIPFAQWPGSVLKTGLPNFIKAIIFYYYTISLIDSEKKLKTFTIVFLVCQSFRIFEPMYLHITTGYWGSSTHMGEGEMMARLAGAPSDIINSNGLAFVIATVIPFYHYLCLSSSKKLRLLYLTVLPIFLYTLVLTASRSGFLALIVILAGIFLKTRKKVAFAVIVTGIAVMALSNLTELQKERYLSISRDDVRGAETAKGRILGVKDNFKLALNKPVFGYGLGTSREASGNFMNIDLISHNLYTEIMIELGIVGLILFLVFIQRIISNFYNVAVKMKEKVQYSSYLKNVTNAMQVWLLMNILFSFASYGLSSYEWYLFGGLSVVIKRLVENNTHFVQSL